MNTALNSVKELNDFLDEVSNSKTEHDAIPLLCSHYLNLSEVDEAPEDPFSEEYRSFVLRIYKLLSGREYYDPRKDERSPFNIEEMSRQPPCYRDDGAYLARFLHAFAAVIDRLDVKPSHRVLEYGPGDGQIALHLARLGCRISVIDIEPNYLSAINLQAQRSGVEIQTILGDFMSGRDLGLFDRILFFESFHHAMDHQSVLKNLQYMLTEGGKIVFAGEPIIDPLGPWRTAVPYPWGLRLDALSLRAVRSHGWLELGFQEPYFREACARAGWCIEHQPSEDSPVANAYVASRS